MELLRYKDILFILSMSSINFFNNLTVNNKGATSFKSTNNSVLDLFTYQNVKFPKFLKRFESTFYVLSLKEWYLDVFMQKWVFFPIKRIGKYLRFITFKNVYLIFIPIYILGIILL